MKLLEEFKDFDENYLETFSFIEENGLENEITRLLEKGDFQGLYELTLEYGILSIFKFLYQYKKIDFDANMLNKFWIPLSNKSEKVSNNNLPIETGNSNKNGMTISVQDKFTLGRDEVLKYFIKIKARSKYMPSNGKYWYKYTSK